jgi:large subunit ribosomal protein L3
VKAILGKKLGMTQLFDPETGEVTPVTVIEAGPCPIVRVKTVDSDGYEAVQLAFDPVAQRKVTKARLGQLGDAGPHRKLVEFRGTTELTVGEPVTVETFEPGDKVKVSGIGMGKGFAGTIKRHNFHRGPVSHGSHNVRAPGSIGASADPARVFKGIRGPGQMGNKRVTQKGLEVVRVDTDRNLLLLRGSVPGPKGSTVEIRTDS